jgi:NAD(P)-dependent dehydrogenase (short-subunit alcohol dehydrogenase family)
MDLQGKTILITGASSGIGRATALLAASEGASLVLGARRAGLLDTLVEEIVASGARAVRLAGDVRQEAFAKALVDLAVGTFGGLDGAFNNAGSVGALGPVPKMEADNWDEVIAVNLSSAFYAAKYQIPAMGS